MTSAVDVWAGGARRAWTVRARVGRLQGLRALVLLGPELVGVWALDRWVPEVAILSMSVWMVVECTLGAVLDRETTRAIRGDGPPAAGFVRTVRVALARTIAPLVSMALPVCAIAAYLRVRAPHRAAELVPPVLVAAVATLATSTVALLLHLRMAVAYAAEDPAQAPRWARTCAELALAIGGISSTMRFGAAWGASALVSVAHGGWAGMVVAIAVAGVATRALALAGWAEAWRVTTVA